MHSRPGAEGAYGLSEGLVSTRIVSIGSNLSFGAGSENEIYVLPSSAQGGPNCGLPAPWRALVSSTSCISLSNFLTSRPSLRHQSSFEDVPFQLISSFPSITSCGEGARPSEKGAESGILCSRLLLLSHPRQGSNTERQRLTAPN